MTMGTKTLQKLKVIVIVALIFATAPIDSSTGGSRATSAIRRSEGMQRGNDAKEEKS